MTWNYDAQPKEHVACNLCGNQDAEVFATVDRYGLNVSSWRCRDCTLVYLSPRMTTEAYAQFYRDGIYRELVNKVKRLTRDTDEGTRLRYAYWLNAYLQEFLEDRAGSLLDVGGSEGQVADAISKRFKFAGAILEPSQTEGAKAKALGLEVIEGSLETWDPAGRQFELVTLCQTVDHLLDIKAGFAKIRSMLKPGGLFFVDISDWRCVLFRVAQRRRVVKIDHPFYLTPITTERYLTSTGFKIKDRIGGFLFYQQAFLCEAA